MLEGLLPLSGYVRFFVTLTAVLDPFLAVPIFLALTAARGAEERAALAIQTMAEGLRQLFPGLA